ncbi:hypothetical protein PIB30_049313 [Stylosanthes scabra]|uniref:Uncharacterized protein n=1 Tax=Stylosanthes scabra TaxID=79078 RepID=A0ABU6UGP6_9FABA|nr:hypothetical protein [Stylosanthes scabra]
MSDKNYVMKTIPRDLFRVSDDFESDSPVIYAREPCEPKTVPSLPNDNDKVALVRIDLLPEILNMAPKVFAKQRCEEEDESEAEYMEDDSEDEYMEDESQDEYMEDNGEGENTKRRRIITLGKKELKEKSAKEKNYSFEVTQVKSSAELLKLYNIKIEKTNAENNKSTLQVQGPKGPTGNQPITIEEDVFDGQARHPKKTKTIEDDTSEQHDNSSEDEEENASDMDPDKKGMSLDMYFRVHGINLDEEEDEEDKEDEEDQEDENDEESKKWVMQALCRAWKKYKGEVKLNHFTKYKTRKRMLKNRPLEIPEVQFRKLIRYWSLPEIKAMSEKNIENRSKQTCPHRTGSTGFGIRDSKENNEEPSRAEIFTVTRTSKKGKEIDPKSQSTIPHRGRQNHEEAFVQVLRKDQPGRLRYYGALITKSSLKRHEEIRQVRGEYDDKVSLLERQMEGVCDQEILPIPPNQLTFHPTCNTPIWLTTLRTHSANTVALQTLDSDS